MSKPYNAHNYRSRTMRPRKADAGHTVVRVESWTERFGFSPRKRLTCECGRRYSGQGERAYYSHSAHLRASAAGR